MTLSKLQQTIEQRQQEGKEIINMSYPDFTFYQSPLNIRKIQKAFKLVFKYPYYYPTAKGDQFSLEAVELFYKQKKRKINPDNLILTSSVNQALMFLLKSLAVGNKEILVPTPRHQALDEIADIIEVKLKDYPLIPELNWQPDLSAIKKLISDKTGAIFLMSPHHPTGSVISEENLKELLSLSAERGIPLIMDESQADFIYNGAPYPSLMELAGENQMVITLSTVANAFALPGVKVSWLYVQGPDEKTAELLTAVELMADTFLTLDQIPQTVLPEIVDYSKRWRKKFARKVEKNRNALVDRFKKVERLRLHFPEGGFYALVEVLPPVQKGRPPVMDQEKFVIQLLEETGVYVHPGNYYKQNEGCYIMISFLQDPGVLRRSLKSIVKFLKGKKNKTLFSFFS